MKWFKAIIFTIFLTIQVLLLPILFKYYELELNIKGEQMIGVTIFSMFLILLEFIIMIILYICAVRNKKCAELW